MSEVTVNVTGLQEVNRVLYSYSQKLGDDVTRKALRVGANLMVKKLRGLVPVKTGKLRRGFRVSNSKIHNGKRSTSMIGLYLTLKKDAFYGRFQNDGWNFRGKALGTTATGKRIYYRNMETGKRSSRTTAHSDKNIPAKQFFKQAFESTREQSAALIVAAAEAGAEVVARKVGL